MKKLYLLQRILRISEFIPIIRNFCCIKCFEVTNDNDIKDEINGKIVGHFVWITVVLESDETICFSPLDWDQIGAKHNTYQRLANFT